ncbi:unnamed protein product [Ilex paraguariensis]|uniref:Uncharacterized protein n=1 Tax=Ilex paraguariensis TaxID=185542 RepID=A0ABC8QPW1_9AQUA
MTQNRLASSCTPTATAESARKSNSSNKTGNTHSSLHIYKKPVALHPFISSKHSNTSSIYCTKPLHNSTPTCNSYYILLSSPFQLQPATDYPNYATETEDFTKISFSISVFSVPADPVMTATLHAQVQRPLVNI